MPNPLPYLAILRVSIHRLLLVGLLLAATACGVQDAGPVAVSNSATIPRAGKALPFEGHHPSEALNPYPSYVGPVPQERGQDNRPAELPPLDHKGTVTTTAAGALVLYDKTGPYGWLGELYGIAAVTLASHFGPVTSKPVASYAVGDLVKYKAVIYVGSTYNEPLPVGFLDDVLKSTATTQVIWMYDNIWQLANRSTSFVTTYGYNPYLFDTATATTVTYKGVALTRDALNGGGLMTFSNLDPSKVTTLATAQKSTGATLPWAVRSKNLTYFTEIPFAYIGPNDRYLAFCDLLFDALAPSTAVRHRALVRLEDVSPAEDPVAFKAIVDYLYGAGVPFSVALIPVYTDPLGYYNGGKAQTLKWKDRPQMQAAIAYASSHGGTLVLHGYTHQFSNKYNPYSGVSADDFEFFASHVDATNNVIYDGAVAGDSAAYALGRVTTGQSEVAAAGFVAPTIFEFPHYAGTPTDSKAIRSKFNTVYHRGLYFSGALGLNAENLGHTMGLYYPYTVTDVYGYKVLPENLGNYEPEAYNNHPPRLAADLIATAQKNLVVRDGTASFFFHPYYPLSELKATVQGVKSAGYAFVAPSAL